MSRLLGLLACVGLTLVLGLGFDTWASDSPSSKRQGSIFRVAGKPSMKKKAHGKKGAPKKAEMDEADKETKAETAKAAPAEDDASLKFSRDIAPIFVNVCAGCHNEKDKQKNGKFDLTTFDKLMKGSDADKVIVPGNPDESHLVLRIRGEEKKKMPPGANRNLAPETIEKIENWIKAGARLDAGISATAPMASYASTPEQVRRNKLAKMTGEERDKLVEGVAKERWLKAAPKVTPEITPSAHYLLFSNLPKDRSSATVKEMEKQYGKLRGLFATRGPSSLDWVEKTSLFVFNDKNSLVEFVRTIENRELDETEQGTANFTVPQPYVAAVDPSGGREEAPASAVRKAGRSKHEEEASGPDRTLIGVLTEQLVIGETSQMGKPPRWLTLGLGAYFDAHVEPRSPYVRGLRRAAYQAAEQGWNSKALEALGGEAKAEDYRSIGFALVDWMMSTEAKASFPAFVNGMLAGAEKLDDVVEKLFGASREEFLNNSGGWVAEHYGRAR